MSDARLNPEAPPPPEHVAVLRKDYRPPDWLVPEVALEFVLDPERTRVSRASCSVERNGAHDRPLRARPAMSWSCSVRVDGDEARWSMDGGPGHRARRRPSDDRDRGRIRPARQHQADGPLRVRRHPLHAMRERGLPADHLPPRPARCAVALPGADERRQGALSGAARQRQSRRRRRRRGRDPLGGMGGPLPQAQLSVRHGRRRPRTPTATASRP